MPLHHVVASLRFVQNEVRDGTTAVAGHDQNELGGVLELQFQEGTANGVDLAPVYRVPADTALDQKAYGLEFLPRLGRVDALLVVKPTPTVRVDGPTHAFQQ